MTSKMDLFKVQSNTKDLDWIVFTVCKILHQPRPPFDCPSRHRLRHKCLYSSFGLSYQRFCRSGNLDWREKNNKILKRMKV